MSRMKRPRKRRNMIAVDRDTLYFPSQGDPNGEVHVIRKWGEAQMMSAFLLTAISRANISIDALDLKGTALSIKEHVEANPLIQGARTYPGDTMIASAIATIEATRDYLATQNDNAEHPVDQHLADASSTAALH